MIPRPEPDYSSAKSKVSTYSKKFFTVCSKSFNNQFYIFSMIRSFYYFRQNDTFSHIYSVEVWKA